MQLVDIGDGKVTIQDTKEENRRDITSLVDVFMHNVQVLRLFYSSTDIRLG